MKYKEKIHHETRQGRRDFLGGLVGLTAALTTLPSWAKVSDERKLTFNNLHTGEQVTSYYWSNGDYVQSELAAINHLLRDHRADEAHAMDPKLLDFLYLTQAQVDRQGAFHVISGYRSPKTNARLRKKSSGVAKKSLHMQGRAIDVRLPGCQLKDLRKAALQLKLGGVGYYSKSGFIHMDTGRVRQW